jgi:hypothetical protein
VIGRARHWDCIDGEMLSVVLTEGGFAEVNLKRLGPHHRCLELALKQLVSSVFSKRWDVSTVHPSIYCRWKTRSIRLRSRHLWSGQ